MQSTDTTSKKTCKKQFEAAAEMLKVHTQGFISQKADAKSILLINEEGKVDEPTTQTLKLLQARTSGKLRRSRA